MAQPSPVASEAAKGPATLPEGRAQAFALDLKQTTVAGNWDLQPTVTGVDERAVTFRTERGESGRLLYRLPEGLRVPLREGQLVAIRRESRGFEASLGYELSVASEGQTVLVTSSTLTVPAQGQEGVAEGRGYALEYVVTAAGEPQPGASPSPPPTAQPAASPGVRP